ncbi:MAG TPA: GNAT family N-acetyltransferase [Rhizomicrobium sp.]|jgi:RimJ/RimL family protein N-acetyltransferase|nr:GNAT family N-acetyltransferase [Rhizomicrobium sp.]
MILKTERLRLLPLAAADATALFAILSDPEAMQFWHSPPLARLSIAAEIIAGQLAAMVDGHFLYWTVWLAEDAIGSIDLSNLDFMHHRGEIGFLFRRDQWGKGYAREAVGAVIDHAFGPLKLERLEARMLAPNRGAKKLVQRLGFLPEGRLAGHVLRQGRRYDVDVFGRLNASTTKNGA